MKVNKNTTILITSIVMAFSTLSTALTVNNNSIAYAADSKALKDARAQVKHLTNSIKTNYLGIKNQGTWELYIKKARELINKLPSYEYNEASSLLTQVKKNEVLVKAIGRINQVELSIQSNHHGIKNASTWREYLKLGSEDLEKVDKSTFYSQYTSLLQRKNKCEAIVSKIEESFETGYFQAVKLHNEAVTSSNLAKAELALIKAKALGESERSDSLIKEINKLILRLEAGEDVKNLIIKEVISVKSVFARDSYLYDDYVELEVEFTGHMEDMHVSDFTYRLDSKMYKASEAKLIGINRWKIRFNTEAYLGSIKGKGSLEVVQNPRSYGTGGGALRPGTFYLDTREFKITDIKFQEGYRSGVNGDEKIEIFFSNDIDPKSIIAGWDGTGSKVVAIPFTINGYNNTDITLQGIGNMCLTSETGINRPPSFINENFKLENATYELTSKNKLTINLNGLDSKYVNAALKFKALVTIKNESLKSTGGVYYNSTSKTYETSGKFSNEDSKLTVDYGSESSNKISLSNNYGSDMIVEGYSRGVTLSTSSFNSLSRYGTLQLKLDNSLPYGVHDLYAVATQESYGRCTISFYGTAFDSVNYRNVTVRIKDAVDNNIGIYPKETTINLTLWTDSSGNLNVYTR